MKRLSACQTALNDGGCFNLVESGTGTTWAGLGAFLCVVMRTRNPEI
jgi:hypothetical protein